MKPNKKQLEVIDNTEGIYIVDAGAGTGKTFTITQRYLKILENNVHPNNIFLVTFTRNAAINMKERVLSKVDKKLKADVIEAPIQNFDSFFFKIVSKHGLEAPKILGIEDNLSDFKLITEDSIMKKIFSKFYNQFVEKYEDEYKEVFLKISKNSEILFLIEQLLSKGIYPTKEGWFLNTDEDLEGNFEEYLKRFNELNEEHLEKRTRKSFLLSKFNKNKEYLDLPDDFEVDKGVNPKYSKIAFYDDRDGLLKFVHQIYFEYIEFMVKENFLTFSLVSMFAFIILYTDDKVREKNSFDYVIVDEFQDTNEMQFMTTLLLMKKPNLCVVGDWKQGIYGFRNATISNIRNFEKKIKKYRDLLNRDKKRVGFDIDKVFSLEFDISYRSSQKILDFSEKCFFVEGNKNEVLDVDEIKSNIVSLKSNFDYDDCSEIKFYIALDRETEIKFILKKIEDLVGKKKIKFFDFEENKYKERFVEYKDIAILSRNRSFGLDIQKKAFEYNIPVVYEGGVQIFEEEPSIVLLAWLKLLLNKNKKDSWVTILEKEGYSFSQIDYILESEEYPEEILEFRRNLLRNKKVINYIVDEIFKRYEFNNPITNALLEIIEKTFYSTLMSISDLITFIEENIESGETYDVEIENTSNAVTIQTIHGSKGLEYPIVFLVNCNKNVFPSTRTNINSISYNEMTGVRSKKVYSDKYDYVFDSWKTDLVNQGLFSDLDEERRLLYVALTRAMFDIYITSYNPSSFFSGLSDGDFEEIDWVELKKVEDFGEVKESDELEIKTEVKDKNLILSAKDFVSIDRNSLGRGKEFGIRIHNLAFRYVNNLKISFIKEEEKEDFENVKNYIDSVRSSEGFLRMISEISCFLKMDKFDVRGVIDLIVEYEDRIEIIDWKTDLNMNNLGEYRKQLSIYYYVLKELYETNNNKDNDNSINNNNYNSINNNSNNNYNNSNQEVNENNKNKNKNEAEINQTKSEVKINEIKNEYKIDENENKNENNLTNELKQKLKKNTQNDEENKNNKSDKNKENNKNDLTNEIENIKNNNNVMNNKNKNKNKNNKKPKKIICKIFWTYLNEISEIEPIKREELEGMVEGR